MWIFLAHLFTGLVFGGEPRKVVQVAILSCAWTMLMFFPTHRYLCETSSLSIYAGFFYLTAVTLTGLIKWWT